MMGFLASGGVLLVPIGLLSLAAVALIIEKALHLYRIRDPRDDLTERTIQALREKGGAGARLLLQDAVSPEARVLLAGLGGGRTSRAEREARMEAQATRRMDELEGRVGYLSSIASLATLLGLLGTVTGMISSFMNMQSSGISDPAVLAGGISQALITTAAGLSVAIPCLFGHAVFSRVIGKWATRMEMAAAELAVYFGTARTGADAARAAKAGEDAARTGADAAGAGSS